MDAGAGAGALAALCAVVGLGLRIVIRADRHDKARAGRQPSPRMVPRSPLLDPPRPRRPAAAPEDTRPVLVDVPDRLLVRAARLVAAQQDASALLLEQQMPVIPAMAERLMLALEGRGIVAARDESGRAAVLVKPDELPEVLARWGIAADV